LRQPWLIRATPTATPTGYLNDSGYPWTYHLEHGWLYRSGQNDSDVWLYARDMGWLFTTDETYPYIYRSGDATWLYYLKDEDRVLGARWFFNFAAEDWEVYPN